MKNVFLLAIVITGLLLSTSANAKQYTSEDYHCQISFPTDFEEDVDDSKDNTVITVSATSGSMIYMLTIIKFKELEEETKENNDVLEVVKLITCCNNLGAKVKAGKNIFSFNVGDEKGYYASNIKAKLNGDKYVGNYFVIMKDDILYQFTALGLKKGYNSSEASRFENSFNFM